MNLDYNVLWIDDRPRLVEDAIEHIKVRLARKGFNLNVKMLQDAGNDKSLQRQFYSIDFDLLVVDYKMQAGARDGAKLIKSIRRFCDSTDIVFYSSDTPSALRNKIDVDGVYCANRNHLSEKLDHVIHSTIKKVLDLNNMRGISLAQLADFDHVIDEMISTGYEKLVTKGISTGIIDNICEKVSIFHVKSQEDITKLPKDMHISEYITLLSSNPKYDVLIEIIALFDDENLDACARRISRYGKDIIGPRNRLAHAMEKRLDADGYVLENRSKEIRYSSDDFTSLRLKLLEYRDQFQQIKNIIDQI